MMSAFEVVQHDIRVRKIFLALFDRNGIRRLMIFAIQFIVFQSAFPEERPMHSHSFLTYREVLSLTGDDHEFSRAVKESQRNLAHFRKAFESCEASQTQFLATLMQKEENTLVPYGMLIETCDKSSVRGRIVSNALPPSIGGEYCCSWEQVVDWRYIDTFECIGGRAYRALLEHVDATLRRGIENKLPFVLTWDVSTRKAGQFKKVIRHIANRRYRLVEEQLRKFPHLRDFEGCVPRPSHTSDGRCEMSSSTVAVYSAEFGDERIVGILKETDSIQENKGEDAPLCWSAIRGNVATTKAMLDIGFEVDVRDKHNYSPLQYAVMWDRKEVVQLLLENGAEPNQVDSNGQTPIFLAESLSVLKLLLNAGADVDVADENGQTSVECHLDNGRQDIADALIAMGASAEASLLFHSRESIVAEESVRRARKYLLSELGEKGVREIQLRESVDYGFILPIRGISIRPAAGSQ